MTQKYARQVAWRKEEISAITELYKDVGPKRLTDVICRTGRAIEKKAGDLGLRRITPRWTKPEIGKLKTGEDLNRSPNAVRIKKCRVLTKARQTTI